MSDRYKKTISVTIDKDQDVYLDELAKINSMTKSYFIRFAIKLLMETLEGAANVK